MNMVSHTAVLVYEHGASHGSVSMDRVPYTAVLVWT